MQDANRCPLCTKTLLKKASSEVLFCSSKKSIITMMQRPVASFVILLIALSATEVKPHIIHHNYHQGELVLVAGRMS